MYNVSWAPDFTQFSVNLHQKCCNWHKSAITSSGGRKDSLFKISKKNRLFLNHPFAALRHPVFFWVPIAQVLVFDQSILSQLAKIDLFIFSTSFNVSHCAAWRSSLTYPAIWKVAFPGSRRSSRSLKTPLLQLEKLVGAIRRSLALQLPTRPEPKENNGEAVECWMLKCRRGNPECGLWVPVSSLAGRPLWYVLITAWERLAAGAETCWPTGGPKETHTHT